MLYTFDIIIKRPDWLGADVGCFVLGGNLPFDWSHRSRLPPDWPSGRAGPHVAPTMNRGFFDHPIVRRVGLPGFLEHTGDFEILKTGLFGRADS